LPLAVFRYDLRYEPPDYEQERRPGRPRPRRDVARWVIMGCVSEDMLEGAKMIQQQQQVIEVTGLRNPCAQLDRFRPGLMAAVLDRDEKGGLVRKAGVMGVVLSGGEVRPGDAIQVEPPPGPHRPLEPV
jgi:MOSC domain-containing protein YiiM